MRRSLVFLCTSFVCVLGRNLAALENGGPQFPNSTEVAYTTLDNFGNYWQRAGIRISGKLAFPIGYEAYACQFVPLKGGNLSSIEMGLAYSSWAGADSQVDVRLSLATGELPLATPALASGTLATPILFGAGGLTSFIPSTPVQIEAGRGYWLTLTPHSDTTASTWCNPNYQITGTFGYTSPYFGFAWFMGTGPGLKAFRVNVSPIPMSPTISCPAPSDLECTNGGLATFQVQVEDAGGYPLEVVWMADGVAYQTNNVPSGGTITSTNLTFTASFGLGEHLLEVFASNAQTPPAKCSALIVVRDTSTPTINCPPDLTVSANAGCAASDVHLGLPIASDTCGVLTVTNNAPMSYPLGTNLVTWSVIDGGGNSASCVQRVIVADTTPPEIVNIRSTPSELWPPNHRMVQVNLRVETIDNCDSSPTARIAHITSNQPQNPSAPDWEITGLLSANLRAERLPNWGDRVYAILVEARDFAGNATTRTVSVTVPKSPSSIEVVPHRY